MCVGEERERPHSVLLQETLAVQCFGPQIGLTGRDVCCICRECSLFLSFTRWSERTVCRCLSSLTFERIPWKDGSLPSCMNCGCVIYYSDLLLIRKADTVLSCGGQTVMSAPDIIFTRTLQQVAVRGAWTRSSMLEDHLLNYRVTLTPRWGMIYKRHYTLSVHNSNKNPGHSRMITIISVIRLFREREREVHSLFSLSARDD